MSVLLLSILNVSSVMQHCPMRREISPCTCSIDSFKIPYITCDRMTSFQQVVNLLGGNFNPREKVYLQLSSSTLNDLPYRSFSELNLTIGNLRMNHDVFGIINPASFKGLSRVTSLSLADNTLDEVPELLWREMPNIKTLDLDGTNIKSLHRSSFEDLHQLDSLLVSGNQISQVDSHSIPNRLKRLHLGRNIIKDLNNTLRALSELNWLFINGNNLTNLDGQLPSSAPNLKLIHASNNRLEKLPNQLRNYPLLESLFFGNNKLKSLDGALSQNHRLQRVVLENNRIDTLTEADFSGTTNLAFLLLGQNEIASLNNSLTNLKKLRVLNLTSNRIVEFSFEEIAELKHLGIIDLSYNKITTLTGPTPNLVEWNIKLSEIKLDHNQIESLNGALSGLTELSRLDLSYNKLKRISPEDFMGLEQLRLLNVSNNQLTTLEETSRTYLPRLSELIASHNYLSVLEKDFHGLPVLCDADLSNNQIVAIGKDLIAKTRCAIEHGVHEGTWDTLKINLQDNPILCDAALPDIVSIMNMNHTRIYGVSHCPPLSEQPASSKHSDFFGYLPETTPSLFTIISANHTNDLNNQRINDQTNQSKNSPEERMNATSEPPNYQTSHDLSIETNERTVLTPQKISNDTKLFSDDINHRVEMKRNTDIFDTMMQRQQIDKLAIEIDELRSRVDILQSQNQLFNNQLNIISDAKSRGDLTELNKP